MRDRAVTGLLRLARTRPSAKYRRQLLAVAIVLFLGVILVALPRLPDIALRWKWLIAAAGLTVGVVIASAVEYWLAGQWLGFRVGPLEALRVTVFASAANLAPIPGAVLVRARDLFSRGAQTESIGRALATIGAGWVTMSFLVAAVALWLASAGALPFVALVVAAAIATLVPRVAPTGARKRSVVVTCLLTELVAVTVQAARYYAIFRALSVEAAWHQALALPLAGALASAAGFFPGGLGLRELLAGGMAELVALPAAAGVVGSAADRILGLIVLAVVAAVMLAVPWKSNSGKEASPPPIMES